MTGIVSLFSGYEGLGMAVEAVTGLPTIAVSDIDPGACKILAHRYPGVPNLGDVTTVDWAPWVGRCTVLTGGFPCQDVSHAGKRAGLQRGVTRSGLWGQMARAIEELRPALVAIENVRGLLSAAAGSDVEQCPWCVGDGEGEPPLRALGAVPGDLADVGYDAEWVGLRAADVGAPHGRFRVFIVAYPAGHPWRFGDGNDGTAGDAAGGWDEQRSVSAGDRRGRPEASAGDAGRDPGAAADTRGIPREPGWVAASREAAGGRTRGVVAGRGGASTADTTGDGWDEGRAEPTRFVGRPDAPQRGDAAPDAGGERHGGREDARRVGRVDAGDAGEAREWERSREVSGDRSAAATPNTAQPERGDSEPEHLGASDRSAAEPRERSGAVAWGDYGPAVRQWGRLLGRDAPAPTELSPQGGRRLSPRFVEWMQGLPEGWVIDVPGLTRNEALKALGNGVVSQQCEAALRHLLARPGTEAVA